MLGTKHAGTRNPKSIKGRGADTFNPGSINPFPEFVSVGFSGRFIYFKLDDGRKITIPISSFPKLEQATPTERLQYHNNGVHIFWDALDEIIGVKNVLGPNATKY